MPLRISTGEVCTFANTWHCEIHGLVGDINGPVHLAVCRDIRTLTKYRERRDRTDAMLASLRRKP